MGCFMLLQYDLGVDWIVSYFVRNLENSFVIRSKKQPTPILALIDALIS